MNFDLSKNIQILNLLANKEGWSINYTKAIKLLFFADKLYLRNFWKTISGDNYSALKLGPVPSSTFNVIKSPEEYNEHEINQYIKKDDYNITSITDVDMDFFSKKEIETLDKIYQYFWSMNYQQLIDETHKYVEWKRHEHIANAWSSANMTISDFFENSVNQHEIFDMPDDDLELSKSIFLDYNING